jgi:hypothetical protein
MVGAWRVSGAVRSSALGCLTSTRRTLATVEPGLGGNERAEAAGQPLSSSPVTHRTLAVGAAKTITSG